MYPVTVMDTHQERRFFNVSVEPMKRIWNIGRGESTTDFGGLNPSFV